MPIPLGVRCFLNRRSSNAQRSRADVADVAADGAGNVLTSFWVSRSTEKRRQYDDPSFYYRWRSPDGRWQKPQSLPAHWSSAPKVEFEPNRGFFLLWQFTIQNEGADFTRTPGGKFIVAGNVREKFEGPVGAWALMPTSPAKDFELRSGSGPGGQRPRGQATHASGEKVAACKLRHRPLLRALALSMSLSRTARNSRRVETNPAVVLGLEP